MDDLNEGFLPVSDESLTNVPKTVLSILIFAFVLICFSPHAQ